MLALKREFYAWTLWFVIISQSKLLKPLRVHTSYIQWYSPNENLLWRRRTNSCHGTFKPQCAIKRWNILTYCHLMWPWSLWTRSKHNILRNQFVLLLIFTVWCRPFGPFKNTAVDRNFGRSKLCLWTIILDSLKLQLLAVILDYQKVRLWNIILDLNFVRSKITVVDLYFGQSKIENVDFIFLLWAVGITSYFQG